MNRPFKWFLLISVLACGGATESDSVSESEHTETGVSENPMEQPSDLGMPVELCRIESVEINARDLSYEIFQYEASGSAETGLCSMEGAPPIHTVTQSQALSLCEDAGWRLCSLKELQRACQGTERRRYPYGPRLVEGRCNIRDAYVPEGSDFSTVAPSGHFRQCVSQDGVYDLTGNVWEWAAIQDETYIYYGSGYRLIAERHRDEDHACDTYLTLPPAAGARYKKSTVGFRCCRDVGE